MSDIQWARSVPYVGLILLALGIIGGCGSSTNQQTSFHERLQAERERVEHELHMTRRQRRDRIAHKLGLSPSEAQHLQEATPEKHRNPKTNFTPEEKKLAEQEKDFCEVTPAGELATEYDVADNPAAIAHAVGSEYRNRVDMQIAAETGCLEGLHGR